jgi:Lon protease-like protein
MIKTPIIRINISRLLTASWQTHIHTYKYTYTHSQVGAKSAHLVGTLMRISSFTRRSDSRLLLVVQGLARVRVLEQTQVAPYSRATCQLLPDAEIVQAHYEAAAKELGGGEDMEKWVHTVAHAAAVAGEMKWMEYEVSV